MQRNKATRRWQIEAIEAVLKAWQRASSNPLLAVCPGAGKTRCGGELVVISRQDFGSGFALVVSPTVTVKESWHEELATFGLASIYEVPSADLKDRLAYNESLIGDRDVICITYAQLAREPDLFAEMLRRHRGLLVADEPHHADENKAFGEALNMVAEAAMYRLALTGTPFNTRGTPLSMIDSVEEMDIDGTRLRRALPTYSYSYADAIGDSVCRQLEFITVMGRGEVEYRSLLNSQTWMKVTDLAAQRKTDRLGPLLDPDGAFMQEAYETGLKALMELRTAEGDRRAAMMIIVSNTEEGTATARALRALLAANPEWAALVVEEIYHDTPDAHERINRFRDGVGDIVIAVRMISEGVNVPRLRVGVYATNYLTRLFFIQLVGRFIRYESRLDQMQFARMVIPAHPLLLEWAREIEAMIATARIPDLGGDGPGPSEPAEIIGRASQASSKGAILRGEHESDIAAAQDFFARVPSAIGRVPDLLAVAIERAYAAQASQQPVRPSARPASATVPDLRKVNQTLAARIVRLLPHDNGDDDASYALVHASANRFVGIRRLDKLTPDHVLEQRAGFLRTWLAALYRGDPFDANG
jgi:superfamily II DNA or RNA helicase